MSCPGYYEETCISCGAKFQVAVAFQQARRKDHRVFTCPNGHEQYYPGKTAEEKRIEELEKKVRQLSNNLEYMRGSRDSWQQMAEHEQRRRVGYQGALTRAKKNPSFLRQVEA